MSISFLPRLNPFEPSLLQRNDKDHRRVAFRFGGDDCFYVEREGESAIPTPEVDAVHGLRHGDRLACKAFPMVFSKRDL